MARQAGPAGAPRAATTTSVEPKGVPASSPEGPGESALPCPWAIPTQGLCSLGQAVYPVAPWYPLTQAQGACSCCCWWWPDSSFPWVGSPTWSL